MRRLTRGLVGWCLAAAAAVATGCGSSHTLSGAACQRVVTQTDAEVATRAYGQLEQGSDVKDLVRMLAGDSRLAHAIARRDSPAAIARAALSATHGHLSRLQIIRNGRLVADIGRAASLAPVPGTVHNRRDRSIASFTIAKLSNLDYAQLAAHLTGAAVKLSVPGQTSQDRFVEPTSGTRAVASAFSFKGRSFPGGRLLVTLYIPPAGQLCGANAATTRANVIAGVAKRIYSSEAHSLAVTTAVNSIASYRPLIAAVACDDPRATRAAVTALLNNHSHIVRLRVTRGLRLLTDVGGPDVLAPSTGTLRDGSGTVIGRFVMSLQDVLGFRLLTHRFTATRSILRRDGQVVQGGLPGAPSPLPYSGSAKIGGVRYQLVTFPVQAFPAGSLHVTLIVPPAA